MNAEAAARRIADDVELAALAAAGVGFVIDPFNRRWHTAQCSRLAALTTGQPKWFAPTVEAAESYFEQRMAGSPTALPIAACASCRPGTVTARATGTPTARSARVARMPTLPDAPPASWRFSVNDHAPWTATIPAAPTEESRRAFWDVAVPQLARVRHPVPTPSVVLSRVSAPATGRAPAGPKSRAKALLDALHDDRHAGPMYRDLGVQGPLRDDHPSEVRGLAVEVVAGAPSTEYLLGTELVVAGELVASVPVDVAAPNDIAGTPGERERIDAARRIFGSAVRTAFAVHGPVGSAAPAALVVRHRPQRDEDNTWATWIAAVCGTRGLRGDTWSSDAPLAGWAPTAIASVSDPALATAVVYELWV